MAKDKFGLRPHVEESSDFQLGMWTILPDLKDLPEEFQLDDPFPAKDQGNTDFCSAYATCGISQIQEGTELFPEYSFALSKEISGNPVEWGQTLKNALKAHVKYGAIALDDVDPEVLELPNENLRYIDAYPESYKERAVQHKKQSYFFVSGKYDHFDNIRATIHKYQSGVAVGVIFSWDLYAKEIDTYEDQGYGHAMWVKGWTKDALIVKNSYGIRAGDNGVHYVSRDVINHFAGKFGVFVLLDVSPEKARELLDRAEWTLAPWYVKILMWLKNLWK